MNEEISNISNLGKLSSIRRASIEKVIEEPSKEVELSQEAKEIKQFEIKMEKMDHAFVLVKEIRQSLESALNELPQSD